MRRLELEELRELEAQHPCGWRQMVRAHACTTAAGGGAGIARKAHTAAWTRITQLGRSGVDRAAYERAWRYGT
jgi:hypothetical protein